MSDASLPDKYMFKEEYLADYKPGDSFPALKHIEGCKAVVSEPEHHLTRFIQFYIDAVLEHKYLDSIIEGALDEIIYLNVEAGVPDIFPPTKQEMEEKGYFGSIERLDLYLSQLEKALDYAVSKGVEKDKWPLTGLIIKIKEISRQLKVIKDKEGMSSMKVIEMAGHIG